MKTKGDVLVLGSGVAGLRFAIHVAEQRPDLSVIVLTKTVLPDSNSNFAQGGIAAVTDFKTDSFESHIQDTLKSGGGKSNPWVVSHVVKSAPDRIHDLIKLGLRFTETEEGKLDMALEGGHTKARVIHCLDHTGEEVIQVLLKKVNSLPNITCFENMYCMDLIQTISNRIGGVTAFDKKQKKIVHFQAKLVMLATGGCGQVYKYTTNPSVATGDGVSLGIKKGALVSNLQYIQFHPSALFESDKQRLDLITEAIRGFGAYVVNDEGRRFLFEYDKKGELATRDVVSKAIFSELKKRGINHVYLDFRHLSYEPLKKHFPTIIANLQSKGFDVKQDLIPIVPAAHYQCGGLVVNERGQTNLNGLYAIGECADSGLHGVNRLASNSLLEALVFAHDSAEYICGIIDEIQHEPSLKSKIAVPKLTSDELIKSLISRMRETMSNYATIASDLVDVKWAKSRFVVYKKLLNQQQRNSGISESSLIAENCLLMSCAIIEGLLNQLQKKIPISRLKKSSPIHR